MTSKRTLSKRIARGGAIVGVSFVTEEVFGFVRTLVLARMLSPADFALMRMGAIAMATLETLSRTGFDRALIQRKRSVDGTEAEYKDLTLRGDVRDIQCPLPKSAKLWAMSLRAVWKKASARYGMSSLAGSLQDR